MANKKFLNELPEDLKDLMISIEKEQELLNEPKNSFIDWTYKLNDPIPYFCKEYSYEITGYRPISDKEGLDFKHEWFSEARELKRSTGKYCAYPQGTKAYADFWKEQYRRCKYGYKTYKTIHG